MAMRDIELKSAMNRRTFLANSAGAGLVMSLGVVLPGCGSDEVITDMARDQAAASRRFAPTVWFEIDGDGGIHINIAKAEMGQHVGTALARIIADELGAAWIDVDLTHVDSDPKWGYMVTGGSWSVSTTFTLLSQAGAAGRIILRDAGAALLGADPAACTVADSAVAAKGQQISFAEIVRRGDISRMFSEEELAALPVKPAAERRLVGRPVRARDIPAKTSGAAVYGLDVELPGMVFAHPLIPPTRYGSTITRIDDAPAKAIPGYRQTLALDDPSEVLQGWAVVIADNFPSAIKAAAAVEVEWAAGPTADVGEADILDAGAQLAADKHAGSLMVDDGNTAAARSEAASTYSAIYKTSTVLHFTLEPANALVEFAGGKCHIHSGNQWQSLILSTLAKALDMPETDIVIHQYYLGGGFGRRLWGDPMIPAALAAKALGKPVKLVFPRAEDSRFDCPRSPSVQQFDASFDAGRCADRHRACGRSRVADAGDGARLYARCRRRQRQGRPVREQRRRSLVHACQSPGARNRKRPRAAHLTAGLAALGRAGLDRLGRGDVRGRAGRAGRH